VAGRVWRGPRLQFFKKEREKMRPFIFDYNEEIENILMSYLTQGCCLVHTALQQMQKTYFVIAGIGSAQRATIYCYEDDIVRCGCFEGTLAQFESQVMEFHKENPKYQDEYLAAIDAIKIWRAAQANRVEKKGYGRLKRESLTEQCAPLNQIYGQAVAAVCNEQPAMMSTRCPDAPPTVQPPETI
jgi:hypothetical protein